MFARTTPPLLDELRDAVERGRRGRVPPARAQAEGQHRDGRRAAPLRARAGSSSGGEGAGAAVAELQPVYRGTVDELRRLVDEAA